MKHLTIVICTSDLEWVPAQVPRTRKFGAREGPRRAVAEHWHRPLGEAPSASIGLLTGGRRRLVCLDDRGQG